MHYNDSLSSSLMEAATPIWNRRDGSVTMMVHVVVFVVDTESQFVAKRNQKLHDNK